MDRFFSIQKRTVKSILTHFWPALTLLRGHPALATLSLRVNDLQILELWGYAHEVHLD